MSCPNCGKEIDPGQKFCVYCGAPASEATPRVPPPIEPEADSRRSWTWVGAAAVLVVITGLLVYRIMSMRQREEAPREQQRAELVLPSRPEPAAKPADLPPPPVIPTQPPTASRARIPSKEPPPVTTAPVQAPAPPPVAKSEPEPSPAPAATPPPPAVEPAPAEAELPAPPKMRRKTEILRPDPEETAPPPRPSSSTTSQPAEPPTPYRGPSAGTLLWSGQIEKDTLITITGDRASIGRLTGELPGVPVSIDFENKGVFAIVERPGPANNWKKLSLRTLQRIRGGQVIKWTVLESR